MVDHEPPRKEVDDPSTPPIEQAGRHVTDAEPTSLAEVTLPGNVGDLTTEAASQLIQQVRQLGSASNDTSEIAAVMEWCSDQDTLMEAYSDDVAADLAALAGNLKESDNRARYNALLREIGKRQGLAEQIVALREFLRGRLQTVEANRPVTTEDAAATIREVLPQLSPEEADRLAALFFRIARQHGGRVGADEADDGLDFPDTEGEESGMAETDGEDDSAEDTAESDLDQLELGKSIEYDLKEISQILFSSGNGEALRRSALRVKRDRESKAELDSYRQVAEWFRASKLVTEEAMGGVSPMTELKLRDAIKSFVDAKPDAAGNRAIPTRYVKVLQAFAEFYRIECAGMGITLEMRAELVPADSNKDEVARVARALKANKEAVPQGINYKLSVIEDYLAYSEPVLVGTFSKKATRVEDAGDESANAGHNDGDNGHVEHDDTPPRQTFVPAAKDKTAGLSDELKPQGAAAVTLTESGPRGDKPLTAEELARALEVENSDIDTAKQEGRTKGGLLTRNRSRLERAITSNAALSEVDEINAVSALLGSAQPEDLDLLNRYLKVKNLPK